MKYTQLLEWSATGGDIRLTLLGEDDEPHLIEVSAECAGTLVAALAAETLKGGDARQFIRPTGLQTAQTADGEPALLMSLKGGTELPLVFKRESLPVLIAELEKLRRVIDPGGGEVRWN